MTLDAHYGLMINRTLFFITTIIITASCTRVSDAIKPLQREAPGICNYAPGLEDRRYFSEKETNLVIEGTTLESLRQSLSVVKPGGSSNDFATTRWTVQWEFDWRAASAGCRVTSVVATAAIDYQFPVWPQQITSVNENLINQWNGFTDDLRARHCSYGEFGIQAAIEVEQALKTMAARKSCQQLEADANDLARVIVERYEVRESKFRRQTPVDSL